MLEELSVLIKLQNIDNKLMEIEAEQGDLPEQIRNLDKEIAKLRSTMEVLQSDLKQVRKSRSECNNLADAARDQLRKSQAVIYTVKTSREYDAISNEIEQAKAKIAENERKVIEYMAREEEVEAIYGEHRAKLETLEVDYKERKNEMQERYDANRDEETQLRDDREKCVLKIKKPVFVHYERIRKIRNGIGVSYINEDACSYCFSKIPPQRQAEIRTMDELILCETCGCILVGESYASPLSE